MRDNIRILFSALLLCFIARTLPCHSYAYITCGPLVTSHHDAAAVTGAGMRWPFWFLAFDSAWQYPLKKHEMHREGGYKHGAVLLYLMPGSFVSPYVGAGTFLPAKHWRQAGLLMLGIETHCGMPLHLFCDAMFYKDKQDDKACWQVKKKSEVACLIRFGIGM